MAKTAGFCCPFTGIGSRVDSEHAALERCAGVTAVTMATTTVHFVVQLCHCGFASAATRTEPVAATRAGAGRPGSRPVCARICHRMSVKKKCGRRP